MEGRRERWMQSGVKTRRGIGKSAFFFMNYLIYLMSVWMMISYLEC